MLVGNIRNTGKAGSIVKRNPTVEHLTNTEFDDSLDGDPRGVIQVLTEYGLSRRQLGGGFQSIAKLIDADAKDRADWIWVPDANIKIRKEARVVWEALQKAYLYDYEPQALLVAPVFAELQEWLSDPRDQVELAGEITRCLDRNTGFVRFYTEALLSEEYKKISEYYLDLISLRRYLAVPGDDGKSLEGLEASDKGFVMSKVTEQHGRRGKMFARSGRDEFDKSGFVNLNDEAIALLAFLFCVQHEKNVCLLTTDSHLLDIFYKLQWFIDTHYTSWLVGQAVAHGFYGSPDSGKCEMTDHFFEGSCELYKKRSWAFDEVHKVEDSYFSFEIMHVEHDGGINCLRYKMVSALRQMLKSKTLDGRNSTVFPEMNVHIATAAIGPSYGENIIVAKDRVLEREARLPVSVLDIQNAAYGNETFSTRFNPRGRVRKEQY